MESGTKYPSLVTVKDRLQGENNKQTKQQKLQKFDLIKCNNFKLPLQQ
jgi:hypothetical protein